MLAGVLAISICAIASAIGIPGCPSKAVQIEVVRDPWRLEAEEACLRDHDLASSPLIAPLPAIDAENGCGAAFPLAVSGVAEGKVSLEPKATLVCPVVPALEAWLADAVQPAAQAHLETHIVGLRVAASYVCRTRNRKPGARMSEHAYANAIDISEFRTADGRTVAVLDGWKGEDGVAGFLRQVHEKACEHFTTVIGPDGDVYHQDHFHLDLIRRGKKGFSRYCR